MPEQKPPEESFPLPRESEHTGKVRTIVHAEVATLSDKIDHGEKLAKRLQFWGTIAITIFLGGAGTILFLSARFAAARDVEKIVEAQAAASQEFNKHVVTEAAKMGALEEQGKNVESDYHAIREQLWRISDRVGARRVAEPAHVTVERIP